MCIRDRYTHTRTHARAHTHTRHTGGSEDGFTSFTVNLLRGGKEYVALTHSANEHLQQVPVETPLLHTCETPLFHEYSTSLENTRHL